MRNVQRRSSRHRSNNANVNNPSLRNIRIDKLLDTRQSYYSTANSLTKNTHKENAACSLVSKQVIRGYILYRNTTQQITNITTTQKHINIWSRILWSLEPCWGINSRHTAKPRYQNYEQNNSLKSCKYHQFLDICCATKEV